MLAREAPALIATLGLYRFWVATGVRRYLWSHTNLAGEQLDYTGDPLELLVGFLVLLVVLAPLVAIGSVLGIVGGSLEVAYLPLVLLLPLAILALYQARRYRVNNTVFRGLRFHQTGSAWAYALRALLWSAAVVVTLGLAYPWARASLERYKMRHTYFGDVQGSFEGSAWELFKRGAPLWALVGAGALLIGLLDEGFEPEALESALIVSPALGLLAFPVFRAIGLRWRIAGMRFGSLSFASEFSTWDLYKAYLKFLGWLVLLALVVAPVVLVQLWIVPVLPFGKSVAFEFVWVVCLMVGYFAVATLVAFAYLGTVRFDTWRLIVDSLVLRGVDQLDRAKAPAGQDARLGGRIGAAINLGGF
jgi:uncharacterized membrane protein YjgN (DUF898 family)